MAIHPKLAILKKNTIYSYLVYLFTYENGLGTGYTIQLYNLTMASNFLVPYVIPSPQLPGSHGPRVGLLVVAKLLPLSSGLDD